MKNKAYKPSKNTFEENDKNKIQRQARNKMVWNVVRTNLSSFIIYIWCKRILEKQRIGMEGELTDK